MYLDYFGLKRKPFLITPDPAFLYPAPVHQQALAHLQYGLQREGGFLLLTGEVGTGKTTLCRLFMDNLPEDFRLAYLLNTRLDTGGLLSGICRELGIDAGDGRDVNRLVEKIYDNLLAAHGAGKHTLVVIEEAQNLEADVLETLRLLTNLETSATKLLHILLIGQPELLETLRRPALRQLNQRVVSRSHLGALDKTEIGPYIRHRLKMAGTGRPLFTPAALGQIHKRTGGIPRLVNLLAEHCLMGAYATGRPQVGTAIVRAASRELAGTLQTPSAPGRMRIAVPSAAILAVLALGVLLVVNTEIGELPVAPASTPPGIEDNNAGAGPKAAPLAAAPDPQRETPEPAPESGELSAPAAAPNAYRRMLALADIDADANSESEFCSLAAEHGQRCVYRQVESREELLEIDGPSIVRLVEGGDSIGVYLLQNAGGDPVLRNSAGEQHRPLDEIVASMEPGALFLWRPPAGFSEPLNPGETNPQLVDSLMGWLSASGHLSEPLVTGGVYSDYLADIVRRFQADHGLAVDGILGERTLIELTGYGDGSGRISDVEP